MSAGASSRGHDTTTALRRLSRSAGDGRPVAPVRMLHLGVGNFFRAHQAWYTDRSPGARQWGIAAFTGRRPQLADELSAQDCLYTLVTRRPDGDRFEVVSSISEAHAAADHDAWLRLFAAPSVGLVTITVTEAGYLRAADGGLDTDSSAVQEDLDALRADPRALVHTAPLRLVAGLLARRAAGAGPITLVPCDNLPDNAATLRRVVRDAIERVDPELAPWADQHVGWVTTMVDRITPATTDADRELVRAGTGVDDAVPVVTEPFHEWVLSGDFRTGHPGWDAAGARIVPDVVPFEQRKLWLLNGSHSLLAYAGSARGNATVAEAVADPTCRGWVEQWWDEAARHLTLGTAEVTAYRAALLERFGNPAIRHALAQIATDGSQKIPARVLPVLRAELGQGRVPDGATRIVAAWIRHLRGAGAPVQDARADEVQPLAQGAPEQAVRAVLGWLDPALASDERLVAAVLGHLTELAR
ncbi:MAG TPA: mannitol dehydrogenase family protein [Segeticoccus sp.]|uniref:mannitol dehydrogenase family protein n=1 Tax=Segeticoccus sp. TaxID=2706531 RepID=UPI002D805C8E|nr:mannitol dehydrogenase family protein [Segeticoccus sp.]HET8601413.1 mannitol dehydrogenase family protein [Segeticoccus sp.]